MRHYNVVLILILILIADGYRSEPSNKWRDECVR